ncbi:protoporphyrinogen/coproporphyrinogen oxidase [Streptomyces rimosus]|uniref:protoporphyrinogen/coproporphyrinogen oxidase n=1 Tax=Streptomyces rimosus TaxID=1927 RepID=UPI00099C8B90|nr:FAD-dependent oxidoreductase [Streptomyces rimosus]
MSVPTTASAVRTGPAYRSADAAGSAPAPRSHAPAGVVGTGRALARHVVVIGGGIAGLAAAHRLTGAGLRVTLLESTGRLGGKLRSGEIAGVPVDLGAEALRVPRPEAVDLAREVGLGDRLRVPAATDAALWTRGGLRPIPSCRGRDVLGRTRTADTYEVSLRAAVPQLFEAARHDGALLTGVRRVRRRSAEQQRRLAEQRNAEARRRALEREIAEERRLAEQRRIADRPRSGPLIPRPRPEFARTGAGDRATAHTIPDLSRGGPDYLGLDGGAGTLAGAVADAVRAAGGAILRNTPALALTRTAYGWEVRTAARTLLCDSLVLATPAWSAATLLAAEAPLAAAELSEVAYASMALVTMAFRRSDLAGLTAFDGRCGFLVPPGDGHTIKASTFLTRKWDWLSERAEDLFVLRTSIGRYGREEVLYLDDTDLVGAALRDLGEATGLAARPVATDVTRWIGGLPHYAVGHPARVTRVRNGLSRLPGLRLCGAAYDGVGVADCVASGQRAADEIIAAAAA